MWKLSVTPFREVRIIVSVPLRGLDMWKLQDLMLSLIILNSFSPLAGIRYVETTIIDGLLAVVDLCFSPLAGIRYVETY